VSDRREAIAIVGAGSWGTALSMVLGEAGRPVRLWARRPELALAIRERSRNPEYLSQYALPTLVQATGAMDEAVSGARLIILAVPSHGMRAVCELLSEYVSPEQGVVSAAKGLEHETGRRMSEVISESLGRSHRIAVLSGPNLAPGVAKRNATVSVAASADRNFAGEVQSTMSTPRFRVYTNTDVLGVELGGVLKNVIAIGAGIGDGLGFGDNTKAALMTRGLAEMKRLGMALGARGDTFHGLSGMGDLIATCAGRTSRNHQVGYELATGRSLADVLRGMAPQIAEGIETTRAVVRLAASVGVGMPIAAAVHAVLFEDITPMAAVKSLMTRAWRDELDE